MNGEKGMDYLAMLMAMSPECDDVTSLELESYVRCVPHELDPWLYGDTFSDDLRRALPIAQEKLSPKTDARSVLTLRLLGSLEEITDNEESLI